MTIVWKVDPDAANLADDPGIREAGLRIKRGETVAFPTETVYGLGANALSNEAVQKIFEAKGRPGDNPLIVHISDRVQLKDLVLSVPREAEALMDAFWPGPLTIVFPASGRVADKVTAGLPTVAVRMPDHPVARALIEAAGVPIAAPSANRSGRPSPTTAAHVLEDLTGRIAGILDGGATGVGVESTVVDATVRPLTILRPGGVTREQLVACVGEVESDAALTTPDAKPKAPGMKYRHYAPKAPVYLVTGDCERVRRFVRQAKAEGKAVGVLTTAEHRDAYPDADFVAVAGRRTDLATVAHGLYDALRAFDSRALDVIFSETFERAGIGEAIMNRLNKAAAHRVL